MCNKQLKSRIKINNTLAKKRNKTTKNKNKNKNKTEIASINIIRT